MFMRRHFHNAKPFFQGLHGHFLLDGGDVLHKAQLLHNICLDGAESVLAFAELNFEAPVDHGRDERASHEAEKFVEAAMQLA